VGNRAVSCAGRGARCEEKILELERSGELARRIEEAAANALPE
jgi:hypothetical protein